MPGRWAAPPAANLVWTPGYWGAHVGFYGGVNYGFGYSGSGFSGGVWLGNHFHYNTAFVNVAPAITHRVYFNNHPVQSITNVHYMVISHSFNHIQANRIQANHYQMNPYQANRYEPYFSKRISIQRSAPQRYTQTRMRRQPRQRTFVAQHAMYRHVQPRRHRNTR